MEKERIARKIQEKFAELKGEPHPSPLEASECA